MTIRRAAPTMIGILIMVGFFLRLYQLAQVPLRGDEAFTVQYWAQQPLSESLSHTATIEPHPALNYALFNVWGLLAGTSAFSIRFLPALIGTLGIPAVYALGRMLGGKNVGLIAALLFALHPFEIWHAQDARNNAIWAGLSVLTLALGLRAIHKNQRQDWVFYGLNAAITANIFYFEWFTLIAFGIYVLAIDWGNWTALKRWLLAVTPAFVTSLGSFIILQGSLIATGTYAGTTSSRLDLPNLLPRFLPALNFGERTLPVDFAAQLWPFIALAFVLGVAVTWRRNHSSAIFLAAIGVVPLLLLSIASTRLNIFDPRYILSSVPAYSLAFAGLIVLSGTFIRKSNLRWLPGLVIAAMWLSVAGISLYNYYFVPSYAKASDWPALNRFLRNEVTDNDLVIQLSVDAAFGYYYTGQANAPALPEKPSQPISEIEQILQQDSEHYQNIWTVGQTFPDWPNTGVVENWLNSHMQLIRRGQVNGLNYRHYLQWRVSPDEIQAEPITIFGDQVELMGTQVFMPPENTGNLTVLLYWRPLQKTSVPLKVFVHLEGEFNPATSGPVWSQDDHFPQNGQISTDAWEPNVVYRDVYTLPLASVRAGSYTLTVGFYDPNTNQRLTVGQSDFYTLQTIDLK